SPRALHSFPTRRSSDLVRAAKQRQERSADGRRASFRGELFQCFLLGVAQFIGRDFRHTILSKGGNAEDAENCGEPKQAEIFHGRSEEHTSELQSRGHLV